MKPKIELVVLNKKELILIVILLVLVSLLSFTLGVRLGKSLQTKKEYELGRSSPPLVTSSLQPSDMHESKPDQKSDHAFGIGSSDHKSRDEVNQGHEEGSKNVGHNTSDDNGIPHEEPINENSKSPSHPTPPPAKKTSLNTDTAKEAEDLADTELDTEIRKEKLTFKNKPVFNYPKDKKLSSSGGAQFTLQVGSYKTVSEAADQVSSLKRKGLDAFYFEAKLLDKGTWYRVGIGLFPTKEVAENTASQWKQAKSLPQYIVQKIPDTTQ